MLSSLILALLLQGVRVGAGRNTASPTSSVGEGDCLLAPGSAEHFASGVRLIGKLVWPSDVIPRILDVELENQTGEVVDGTKSGPNSQFSFERLTVCKSYYVVINTEGFDIVRQWVSIGTNNFAGAEVKIQLK